MNTGFKKSNINLEVGKSTSERRGTKMIILSEEAFDKFSAEKSFKICLEGPGPSERD